MNKNHPRHTSAKNHPWSHDHSSSNGGGGGDLPPTLEAMTFWCHGTAPYRFMVLARSHRHLGVLKGDGFRGVGGLGAARLSLLGWRCFIFFWVKVPNIIWNSSLFVVLSYFSFGCSQFQSKNAENNGFPRGHWFAPCFWPFLRSGCSKMDDSNFRSCRRSGGMLLGLLTYVRWKMATWEGEM